MTIARFVDDTFYVVKNLDNSNWTERCHQYRPGGLCSVGAHLAHHYGLSLFDWIERMPQYGFEQALETRGPPDPDAAAAAACRTIGCTLWQLDLLLHAAGAPEKPFLFNRWELRVTGNCKDRNVREIWRYHPRQAWANLAQIKNLPHICPP